MVVLFCICWDKILNNFGNLCIRQTKCCVYKGIADWLAGFEHTIIHIFFGVKNGFLTHCCMETKNCPLQIIGYN